MVVEAVCFEVRVIDVIDVDVQCLMFKSKIFDIVFLQIFDLRNRNI